VVYLFAEMEQMPMLEAYNRKKNCNHANNQLAINVQLPYMNCPSTPDSGRRKDDIGGGKTSAAGDYAPPTSYVKRLEKEGFIPKTPRRAGAMTSIGVPRALIRDGTTTTILITEDAGRPQYWTSLGRGPDNEPPGGGSFSGGNFTVINGRVRGAGWAAEAQSIPMHGFLRNGSDTPGPCAMNCTNNNEAFAFHRGGMNAVFADGGVRFLAETMPMKVYAAMITRDGEDEVPDDAF
jgi:prepilin-type processing-associated H-X9-DG protein